MRSRTLVAEKSLLPEVNEWKDSFHAVVGSPVSPFYVQWNLNREIIVPSSFLKKINISL